MYISITKHVLLGDVISLGHHLVLPLLYSMATDGSNHQRLANGFVLLHDWYQNYAEVIVLLCVDHVFLGSYCRVAIRHGCNVEIPWKIWFCWYFQASNWHHFAQYLVIKLSTWECPKIVDLPPINCHLYHIYIIIHI